MKLMPTLTAPVAIGLALASVLAGCGAHPTTGVSSKLRTTTAAKPGAYAAPVPGGATAGAAGPEAVAKLIAFAKQAQTAVPGFSATVVTDDKGPSGAETDEIKVAYQKPSTLHLNMVKASGQAQGATILWTGGDELKIKLTVGFLPITTSLGITDDRLKSKNGWTIKQTEVNAIFKVLFDPAAQIQILGQQAGDAGHMMTTIQVHSALSPSPTDHEVIGIDTQSGLPSLRVLFQGQKQLYRMSIKGLHVGSPSSTEMAM